MNAAGIIAVLVFATTIHAQQNTQTPEQQHAAMMKRGDQGMGFSQEKTTHHFLLLKNGGEINVTANDPKDDGSRDHIRMHLSHVAEMFSEGDFHVPMFIHDTTPPGVPVMKELHKEIHYRYQQTDTGGKIEIETANPRALHAVHDFLRFQIAEHKTGDPTEVPNDAVHR
ncbi:MAG TPA: hypothetical protein VEI52_01070 [Terriglobales bacterium]|nr:hypothetical protein [Terriglobales bacterium]